VQFISTKDGMIKPNTDRYFPEVRKDLISLDRNMIFSCFMSLPLILWMMIVKLQVLPFFTDVWL
jgi:hypothetical protein